MAFKIRYHEDALADLEEIFEWSREKHPETTEQFANDLFDHIELLQALPYIGATIKGHPDVRRLLHSPLYVYYRLDENRRAEAVLDEGAGEVGMRPVPLEIGDVLIHHPWRCIEARQTAPACPFPAQRPLCTQLVCRQKSR